MTMPHLHNCEHDPDGRCAECTADDRDQIAVDVNADMSAIDYNRARPYTATFWREIQYVVGAVADGIPGQETASKLAAYQAAEGIPADGKAGPVTTSRITLHELGEPDGQMFFGGMAIDADGAPDAYHPEDVGLDYLANAGRPGNWWGLATDDAGEPYVQGRGDPCPGYYVSTTAQVWPGYNESDPRRYVDSTATQYVALARNYLDLAPAARARAGNLSKGDIVVVVRGDLVIYTTYSDVGPTKEPHEKLGEGSIATARALGHDPLVMRNDIPRCSRSYSGELVYLVLSGSGKGRPLRTGELYQEGHGAFEDWGGMSRLRSWVTG